MSLIRYTTEMMSCKASLKVELQGEKELQSCDFVDP